MKSLSLRRSYLALFIFQIMPFLSFEQTLIGAKALYASNQLQMDISNRSYTTLRKGNGVGFGVSLIAPIDKSFSFQTSLETVSKRYSLERLDNYQGVFECFNNIYLQLPLLVKFKVFGKGDFNCYFEGGVYAGYWLAGNVRGSTPNLFNSINDSTINGGTTMQYLETTHYKAKHDFSSRSDRRLEVGWIPGMSATYRLHSIVLSANVDYYQSFISQQKSTIQEINARFNRTFLVSVGCFSDIRKIF